MVRGVVLERREGRWYCMRTNGVCLDSPHGPFPSERAVRAFCKRQRWVICEGWANEYPAALLAFRDKVLAEIAGDAD